MKRQIFIGDVQGCHGALGRLLDKLRFDPAADKLRFVGDLVNRGGESLEVLRLVRSLGKAAMTVLGNHDLHLLTYAWELPRTEKKNREFNAILEAPDGSELIEWLQAQPLIWKSLHRFVTDLETTLRLAPMVPKDRLVISESGIDTREDVKRLQDGGVGAFLIGEVFMREADPGEALGRLIAG